MKIEISKKKAEQGFLFFVGFILVFLKDKTLLLGIKSIVMSFIDFISGIRNLVLSF